MEAKETIGWWVERPTVARVYSALLNSGVCYTLDRYFAERAEDVFPAVRDLARLNREYVRRVVRYCARLGISQFLDLGAGQPGVGTVHEIATRVRPGSRCVYVDHDPTVVAHWELVLERQALHGQHAVVHANMQQPDAVWKQALGSVLDPARPVALLMAAVLPFCPDQGHDDELGAQEAVARYRELLPPGSLLAISHVTDTAVPSDLEPRLRRLVAHYGNTTSPAYRRGGEEIRAFLGDFDMVDPGLVWLPDWHLNDLDNSPISARYMNQPDRSCALGGLAVKRT